MKWTSKKLAGILLGLYWGLFAAEPALAGPLAPLVPIVIGAVVKSAVLKIALTLAATIALSSLQKKKKPVPPGIMIEQTLSGGTNSRTIIAGLYATAGSMVTPPMSYGTSGKTPNANLVKIVSLADVPCDGFSRLILNGEYVDVTHLGSGKYSLGGKYAGKGTMYFRDGTQTTAIGELTAVLGAYPGRPWTSTRIGIGVCYVAFVFNFDSELYKQEPDIRIELRGMRFYDVRKDSTAGGVGTHRWDDPATWEFTLNPIVMVYNILRGITLPGANAIRYGGDCAPEDLPVANWAAAMNVCDEAVPVTGGTEPRYRAGFEWSVDDEPASVTEELLKGAAAEIVENGGVYKVRVGAPGLPVLFITDEDFIYDKEEELDPFPGINGSVNTIRAVYPNPSEIWQQHDAPQIQNPDYVAEDQGQEIVADLQFPAVPYSAQVQRIMYAWLEDDRRWRRHTGVLSHKAFALEPLDVISWTSEHNGYIDKLFDTSMAGLNLYNLQNSIAIREVDPTDYDWDESMELPDPIAGGGWDLPQEQAVEGFTVQSWSIKDADEEDRRPAIRVTWDPEGAVDADAVRIVVRLAGVEDLVCDLTVGNVGDAEVIISEGILNATSYEVRGRYVVDRPTLWTSWIGVTVGDIKLGPKDLDFDDLLEQLGPSILIPSLVGPPKSAMIQQIIDAAFNDSAIRNAEDLRDDVLGSVFGNQALIRQEATTRLTADEAFTSILNVQISRIDDNTAAILSETTTRANADLALAADISSLSATVDGNTAAISAETLARTTADDALALDISTLSVEVGDNTADIASEAVTRANADSAIASDVTTITARLNNAGGSGVTVESAFTAQASDITGLKGEYTLRINVNGRVSGFGLANGSAGSEFSILADRFIVVDPANNSTTGYPFQVVGGNVYIRKAFIQTITSDQITTGTFITLSAQIGNGIITNAKIGNLEVDTIKIANNALTVPFLYTASSVGITPGTGEYTIIETAYLTIGAVGYPAMAMVSFYCTTRTSGLAGYGPDAAVDYKMYIDPNDGSGYTLMGAQSVGIDVSSGSAYFWIPVSMVDMEINVIQPRFKVTATCVNGPNGAAATGINIGAPQLVVQGVKR